VPSSIVGHRHLGAELQSTRAGKQRDGSLLSSATLDRPASSLRRTRQDAKPSHHHSWSSRRPCQHIPGATELLIIGHFFLTVASFVYPELIPDAPEFIATERRHRLPNTYTGELLGSTLILCAQSTGLLCRWAAQRSQPNGL
jgi:hypothetical protein